MASSPLFDMPSGPLAKDLIFELPTLSAGQNLVPGMPLGVHQKQKHQVLVLKHCSSPEEETHSNL